MTRDMNFWERYGHADPWKTEVSVNGKHIIFKIEPGADVTVISHRQFNSMKNTRTPSLNIQDGSSMVQEM